MRPAATLPAATLPAVTLLAGLALAACTEAGVRREPVAMLDYFGDSYPIYETKATGPRLFGAKSPEVIWRVFYRLTPVQCSYPTQESCYYALSRYIHWQEEFDPGD